MYYIYVYIDPRNNKIFYVGKGTKNRCYRHLSETAENTSNPHKLRKIQSIIHDGYIPIIKKIKYFDNEDDAYEYEHMLIEKYGRYNNGGILTNITKGGKGGLKGNKIHTDEYKKKLHDKLIRKSYEKRYGKHKANEIKKKLSSHHINKTYEERFGEQAIQLKEKIRKKLKGKTLEQIIGSNEAKIGREKRSKDYRLKKYQFKKGYSPHNKINIPLKILIDMKNEHKQGSKWKDIHKKYQYSATVVNRNFKEKNLIK